MAFHSKAWTASTTNIFQDKEVRVLAQQEDGKKAGLLERLQKINPTVWKTEKVRLYRSRPFAKIYFKYGLAIKVL